MNPFVDISVRPAYAAHLAVVTWKLLPGFELARIFVYRSWSGNRDWTLLNQDAVVGKNYLSDTDVSLNDQFRPAYYRLLLLQDGKEYDSQVIATYDKLTPHEYAAVRKMMNVEFKNMTLARQGLRMLLFTPLLFGTPAPGTDGQTGQVFNTGTPSDPTTDSFGQKFVGGFAPPLVTYVKFSEIGALTFKDMPEGEATDINQDITARVLAFPMPRRDDLFVHPESDGRYAVGGVVQGYFFRGQIPIAFDIKLQLISRADPRMRLPLPALLPDPRTQPL